MSLDDVVRSLSESLLVTKQVNDTARPHPKYNEWHDPKMDQLMQQKRRKEFFDHQHK